MQRREQRHRVPVARGVLVEVDRESDPRELSGDPSEVAVEVAGPPGSQRRALERRHPGPGAADTWRVGEGGRGRGATVRPRDVRSDGWMSLKKIFELLLFSFDTTHSSALMFSTAGTAGPDDVRVLVHRLAASRARTRTRADPGSTHARDPHIARRRRREISARARTRAGRHRTARTRQRRDARLVLSPIHSFIRPRRIRI